MNYALESSSTNRPELEKVLAHYKDDTLKYQAAVFLIENMPGHYSYAGDEILKYYEIGEKILQSALTPVQQRDTLLKISQQQFPGLDQNIVSDLKIIKGDYLIKNIDAAFEQWQTRPWAQHLNFEQFCEFLLPYKCVELQQLDHWRDTLSACFGSSLATRTRADEGYDSPLGASTAVRKEIINKVVPVGMHRQSGYPFLSASTMHQITYGRCSDYVFLGVATMRSLGIPVIIESTPQWGRYRTGHEWYTLLNDKGEMLLSEWDISSDPGRAFFPNMRIPKVFRHTWAINWETVDYLNKAKYKHPFSICRKDVTNEYFATSNLSIPTLRKGIKDKYVYIAAFNGHSTDWFVIDYGILKKGKAEFKNMGRNVLYLALGYDGNGLIPVSKPFILHKNGDVEYIDSDSTCLQEVVLRRKYFSDENVVNMQGRVLNGMIQAANNKDFSDCDTIYTINNLDYPDKIGLNTSKPYRYWRYMSPDASYGSIAELGFFIEKGNKAETLSGTMISSIGQNSAIVNKAFDGDWLTNFETDSANGNWVGMDFGGPVKIDMVRI
ncbi:MAG TPA: hypothetical protein PLK12_16815, partial [Prolixibacteraceae bacterium]|nr:hypothetical protein [Prolixibacteraceae bacterium]